MKYWMLASGSKGNCTVIQDGEHFIVIDCGSTRKYLTECFSQIGLDYHKADGLLVTHEHTDHIKQLKMFSCLEIFAPMHLQENCHVIRPYQQFTVGPFSVLPLVLSHDSEATAGYVIESGEEKLVMVTDTGYISARNLEAIRDADYYIFESNHDVEMLMNSSRPPYLKMRILSDNGHMDNQYSSSVLCEVIGEKTREINLAHISQECNTREKAYRTLVDKMSERGIDPLNYLIRAARQFEILAGGNQQDGDRNE